MAITTSLMETIMIRNKFIKVRVSEAERNEIKDKAKSSSTTVSDLMRHRTLNYRVRSNKYHQEQIRQIARIGSNLNQLARWANTHKTCPPTLETVLCLNRIYQSVKDLSKQDH